MPASPLRSVTLLVAVLLAAVAWAAPPAGAAEPPQPLALDAGWQYRPDPSDAGLAAGWKKGDWEEAWQDVAVPHVFNPTPVDAEFLGTVGWYRLRLTTPATPAGFGWALRFEGVRRRARIWLNGRRIGRNTNPYEAFEVAASGLRAPGRANTLVVRVSNRRSPALREGWWNWGGITRPVSLQPVGTVSWDDVGVLSDTQCDAHGRHCSALARTDGTLVNHSSQTLTPVLSISLRSPKGVVTSRTVTAQPLAPGASRRDGFSVRISGTPELWSPPAPNLYDVDVSVSVDGAVTQLEHRRFGFRFIRVNNGRLFLNGHRLQVRGASIQEDVPGVGAALHDADVEKTVADLKALGANVTRAQYPLGEKLLSRLDEEGILVWSQAPVYHADERLKTLEGRREALDKVRHTVLVARNHPSVMTHSVANELSPYADSMPGTRRFLVTAARITRGLDDTVPASLDLLSYPNIPQQRSFLGFGLLGINSYYGWYHGKPGPQSVARFGDLAPFLRDMKRMYPRQAQMITEFGAEATFKGPAHVKETFAFQARYLDRTLRVVDETPWLSGAIYWTAREFYVKPRWDGGARRRGIERDALHNKGLISYDGTPKPAFFEARRLFGHTPLYPDG